MLCSAQPPSISFRSLVLCVCVEGEREGEEEKKKKKKEGSFTERLATL
jgi:hypothetical protein